MKKRIKILLPMLLVFSLLFAVPAYADTGGSGNVDGGAASVSA